MAEKERLLRLTILCYRNPGMSEDEFQRHWTTEHPALVRSWLAKYKVLKYTQYHTPSHIRERCKILTGPLAEHIADYDGFVELVMRESELERYEEGRQDEYYKEIVAPDEERMLDMERTQVTVGWEECYVEDGKVIDVPEGEANVVKS